MLLSFEDLPEVIIKKNGSLVLSHRSNDQNMGWKFAKPGPVSMPSARSQIAALNLASWVLGTISSHPCVAIPTVISRGLPACFGQWKLEMQLEYGQDLSHLSVWNSIWKFPASTKCTSSASQNHLVPGCHDLTPGQSTTFCPPSCCSWLKAHSNYL